VIAVIADETVNSVLPARRCGSVPAFSLQLSENVEHISKRELVIGWQPFGSGEMWLGRMDGKD
jgi:hypothetical protein